MLSLFQPQPQQQTGGEQHAGEKVSSRGLFIADDTILRRRRLLPVGVL